MTDRPRDASDIEHAPPGHVRDTGQDRPGGGGATDDSPGAPGGTRGTGGASEQDE